jgi:hypothetical protein
MSPADRTDWRSYSRDCEDIFQLRHMRSPVVAHILQGPMTKRSELYQGSDHDRVSLGRSLGTDRLANHRPMQNKPLRGLKRVPRVWMHRSGHCQEYCNSESRRVGPNKLGTGGA